MTDQFNPDALRKEFADYCDEVAPDIKAKAPGLNQMETLALIGMTLFQAAKELKSDLAFQKQVTDAARQHQADLLERAENAESQLTAKTELATLYAASLRKSELEVEALRVSAQNWRDFAEHQTWCATCAESVDSCCEGRDLRMAALTDKKEGS